MLPLERGSSSHKLWRHGNATFTYHWHGRSCTYAQSYGPRLALMLHRSGSHAWKAGSIRALWNPVLALVMGFYGNVSLFTPSIICKTSIVLLRTVHKSSNNAHFIHHDPAQLTSMSGKVGWPFILSRNSWGYIAAPMESILALDPQKCLSSLVCSPCS